MADEELQSMLDVDVDGLANWLDLDADGDGLDDILEAHDHDADGSPDLAPGAASLP